MTTIYCPIYDKYLNEMILKMKNAELNEEKLEILTDFAAKFTFLPEQLSELHRLSENCCQNVAMDKYICLYTVQYGDKNAKHIEWLNGRDILAKLQDDSCKNRFNLVDEALSFPHRYVQNLEQMRLHFSVAPLPKTVAEKSVKSQCIYDKIMTCENEYIHEWFKCIKEIDNDDAIIANFELKLGQNINWKSKSLWEYYFDFLKEKNLKEILEVYQKYTRLYICDKKAVADYRNEIEKFSTLKIPTTKFWIDTIKYEMDFGEIEFAYRILEKAISTYIGKSYGLVVKDKHDLWVKLKTFEKEVIKHEKLQQASTISNLHNHDDDFSLKIFGNYENFKLQKLHFRQSFIQNLLKNASGIVLRKLYSTCKFFFVSTKAPLCYRLDISQNKKTYYCQETLFVDKKDIDFAGINNLHIYGFFDIGLYFPRNCVSTFLSKIKYCHAQYVYIRMQDLTISEFKLLLSKWLFHIFLYDVNISISINETTNIGVTEFNDILENYPSIQYIEYGNLDMLICRTHSHTISSKTWFKRFLHCFNRSQLDTLYFENQVFTVSDLRMFINYDLLKNITLKEVTLVDENGLEMDNIQVVKFIKAEVNPNNNVCVEIL